MNRYFTISTHTFWVVMFVFVATALNQADVYAADDDYNKIRQEDLYKDTDSTSNIFQAPASDERRDRQEDLYKDPDSTSNIFKPDAEDQRKRRERNLYKPFSW